MITNSFPPRGFFWPVFGALVFALGSTVLLTLGAARFEVEKWRLFSAPPNLQRAYLPTYASTGLRSFLKTQRSAPSNAAYEVFTVGTAMATSLSFTRPGERPEYRVIQANPSWFHAWLRSSIYGNQPASRIYREALATFYLAMLGCLATAIFWSIRRRARARSGIHIRGTRLVSISRFNGETRQQSPRQFRGQIGIWLPAGRFGKRIVIPRWLLPYNLNIFGTIGTGKSTLIRWILQQVEARGWLAVVYDPKREFAQEFYSVDRGDWLLDPTIEDCPYWAIETEARDEVEATPWALAFWPDEPRQQPFFKKHPRAIFSYLLSRYSVYNEPELPATCAALGYWLADPRKRVAPLLKGTEHAVAVDPAAKDQSQGLWTTLGEIAKPLRMMPQTPEGRRRFSVKGWSEKPSGWIFMTSNPDTVDAVLPLHSALMDLLILKNQRPQEKVNRPILFVIDEVASLQRLPQLESAAAKQRASGNPIILGIQAAAQLRDRYGDNGAETIMSQAATNIILRNGDPGAARHASGLIGKHEVKRYQESRPAGDKKTWTEQQMEAPVVMESEIGGLRPFRGYFSQGGKVVAIRVKQLRKTIRMPEFRERLIPPVVFREEPEPSAEPYCQTVPVPEETEVPIEEAPELRRKPPAVV